MHINPGLLPLWLNLTLTLAALALLALAAVSAPWRQVFAVPERMHLIAGGAVACAVLWLMNIRLSGDVTVHLLMVTTLTLVVGWSFSLLAGAAALVAFYLVTALPWQGFPVSLLLTVALPALITRQLARALYRPRLANPFFYILGAGFAGGGLVVVALAGVWLVLFSLLGQDAAVAKATEVWPLLLLMTFSEGFMNGMCIAALAVFYPDAVKTFDDEFYFGGG